MEKRTFLKTGFLLSVSAVITPLVNACKAANKVGATAAAVPAATRNGDFTLPPLPYSYDALEPNIDKMTMEIHHDRHHAGYVKNLNAAIKDTMYANMELEDILLRVGSGDQDKGVRNNAGGHWNHSLFWQVMSPSGGGMPIGPLAKALEADFGSFDAFKEQFSSAAKTVFGSGWAWLCVGDDKKLFITATPNQDNPLMIQIVKKTGTPILGLDVWEHAYYLKYQNKRPDYVGNFFNVINWKEVAMRWEKAVK